MGLRRRRWRRIELIGRELAIFPAKRVERYYANKSGVPNKKWQFTFADFKSCWLIHGDLFLSGSASLPSRSRIAFGVAWPRERDESVGPTKTSVVGQEEKRRLVQLIYSGPSPPQQNITLSVLIFYSPGNIPLRLIRLETLCLPRRGEN